MSLTPEMLVAELRHYIKPFANWPNHAPVPNELLVMAANVLAARNWQPIETAPHGRAILVWKANTKEQYVAAKIIGAHGPGWCTQDGCELFQVTHWMPLPEAP